METQKVIDSTNDVSLVDVKSAISSKEKTYFNLAVFFSILPYCLIILFIIGLVAKGEIAALLVSALYVGSYALIFIIAQGFFVGQIRGNGIKVTQDQFPEVYNLASVLAKRLQLKELPDIYVMESGGLLNAMATKFLSKNIVILYSDVLEMAYENGEEALNFIIAHELAHIKCSHIQKRLWLLPGLIVPFLAQAYSRGCEYTCDNIATALQPEKAEEGLLLLAAGKRLYKKVNVDNLTYNFKKDAGFWTWLSEIFSTHPQTANRIINVIKYKLMNR